MAISSKAYQNNIIRKKRQLKTAELESMNQVDTGVEQVNAPINFDTVKEIINTLTGSGANTLNKGWEFRLQPNSAVPLITLDDGSAGARGYSVVDSVFDTSDYPRMFQDHRIQDSVSEVMAPINSAALFRQNSSETFAFSVGSYLTKQVNSREIFKVSKNTHEVIDSQIIDTFFKKATPHKDRLDRGNEVNRTVASFEAQPIEMLTFQTSDSLNLKSYEDVFENLVSITSAITKMVNRSAIDGLLSADVVSGNLFRLFNNPNGPTDIQALPYLINLDPTTGLSVNSIGQVYEALKTFTQDATGESMNDFGGYIIKGSRTHAFDSSYGFNQNLEWKQLIEDRSIMKMNIDYDTFNVQDSELSQIGLDETNKYSVFVPRRNVFGAILDKIGLRYSIKGTDSFSYGFELAAGIAKAKYENQVRPNKPFGLIMNYDFSNFHSVNTTAFAGSKSVEVF